MWSSLDIVGALASGLREAEARLAAEHAVYGLDALDEVGLHPLLAEGLRSAGFGVWTEHPYPGNVERRALRRDRERCDLVLTENPEAELLEPVARLRELDAASGTLFEPVAEAMVAAGRASGPGGRAGGRRVVEAGEAYWLEVKTVAQWAYVNGVPQGNAQYAAQLVGGPERDLLKLAREPRVCFGGVAVVVFCDRPETGEHDLTCAAHKLLDRGTPVGSPDFASLPIEDRAGNGTCVVGLFPAKL